MWRASLGQWRGDGTRRNGSETSLTEPSGDARAKSAGDTDPHPATTRRLPLGEVELERRLLAEWMAEFAEFYRLANATGCEEPPSRGRWRSRPRSVSVPAEFFDGRTEQFDCYEVRQ